MLADEFEARMRSLEVYHTLRLPPGAWVVLRLDGRGFSRFTAAHFEKPFDVRFHNGMVRTTEALLRELQGLYAYTESDEISVLLPRTWDMFDRELEKAISLSAGVASAVLSLAFGEPVHFDGRAVIAAEDGQVVDYFRWRQADAARCALNGWAYWTLRARGESASRATAVLQGSHASEKHELLFQAGVNFNDLPAWQRRGTGCYWETYEREGYNPKLNQRVVAIRRRIRIDRELPVGEAYTDFIGRRLHGGAEGIGTLATS